VIAQIEDGAGPMSVEIDLTAARVRIDEKWGEAEVIERDLAVERDLTSRRHTAARSTRMGFRCSAISPRRSARCWPR